MTYDEALTRIESIIRSLEQTDAISVTEYKAKAEEAKKLLDFCETEIKKMEKELCD